MVEPRELRNYAGVMVNLRFRDGSEIDGLLRTELLGEQSCSVFVAGPQRCATVYLDQIERVEPVIGLGAN